ncbi:DNA-binding response regulator [Deinococcus irradiatisoli]|uniref:DNA-binding response regulator n=1 Tax=Deinococcus irradiatisoli TaxID=2202254 RepID=A0A2Z3JJE4_9DEIO|nr:response regulator [Deinococcus irradiatisoli]AWN23039.1 DNA-binding response regulator [Deinococcus irradiatisoli]
MSATILIVEDEARLGDILEQYLRREGFHTERAATGPRALELWRAARPALLLLDLMLPGLDGLEVARRVRAESEVPIIMLTARDEEVDRLVGLGIGADDYVVKPYSPREVVARVRAVLRRSQPVPSAPATLHVGALTLDTAAFEARCGDEVLDLTVAELRLLAALAQAGGAVKSRSELLFALGALERGTDERTVDAHVKNLRRKLGACGEGLETVRGVGYRLRA